MRNPIRILCLLAGAALTLAAGCPLQTVVISAPRRGSLQDDPSVGLAVKVGRNHVASSAAVRIDGVDLAAALGLVPPFAGAAGNVTIGSDVIAVSDFSYEIPPSGPVQITATLSGLPAGDHAIDADADLIAGGVTERNSDFAVVEPFTLEADLVASAGTPSPGLLVIGDHLGAASLGEALAAPPVAISDGGEVRAGFVSVARGRATGN